MINMFKKLKEAIFQKLKENTRNFSSGPVAKTSHFHCRGGRAQSLIRELDPTHN